MANKLYDKDSIESLSDLEFTRLRPFVYCGDCSYSTQLLVEVFSNAVDEFNLGHGDQIDVTIDKDVVTVADHGQGFIPNEFREDGKTILEAAFSVLNTSGKYREDGTYEGTSLGSFGIGAKLPTYLSHWLTVKTFRDGEAEQILFREGVFEKRDSQKKILNANGTVVTWQPSEEFFGSTEVEISKIRDLFSTVSCLCPGLTVNLTYNGKLEVYKSENGLNDLIDKNIGDKEIITNRLSLNEREGKFKLTLAMTYTSNLSSNITAYVNTGLTDSGSHITQLKTTLTREMNKFFREKKWLKDKDENLTGDDCQEGLYMVFNYTAPSVAYDAQVKSRITSIDTKFETSVFAEAFRNWLEYNEKEVKAIAEKAINSKKAREAAKKAREKVRNESKQKKKALKFDSKLADCYGEDRLKCEVYITEGDSAGGNLKSARDNSYQAVIPIRGKMLNVQKATLDKMQKNAEIVTIAQALGLEINEKTMKLKYEEDKLRYGKIIIASDADVDGAHIKNLFYTFIWNFCPELIIDGYVYGLVPPLYRIIIDKKTIYLKGDKELDEFKKEHPGKKYTVNRLKGLGEMSEDETTILVDPEQRIIKQITVEDIKGADKVFEDLMGAATTPKKEFIKKNSHKAVNFI